MFVIKKYLKPTFSFAIFKTMGQTGRRTDERITFVGFNAGY